LPATFSAHNTVEPAEAGQKERFSSWALFIMIMLLITALFTSYMLQQKKIQAVHETVISIFAGKEPRWTLRGLQI
jgi:putative copper export protein